MFRKVLLTFLLVFWAVPLFAQSVDTAWVRRYNGPANVWDEPNAMAIDQNGNVYVTGISYDVMTDFDYATVKYNSSGDECWVKRHNGWENRWDGASDIAVDAFGNVYVTGTSWNNNADSGASLDYCTIKYDGAGNELWIKYYNGLADFHDYARGIAKDHWGNIHVTGRSYGGETDFDYATIKYDSSGHEIWVRRYNYSGKSEDSPSAIGVDDSGNIYVTGVSTTSEAGADYATIKYRPSGDTAWIARYNGPRNSADVPVAVAIDGTGNVYVTGYSYGYLGKDDYTTIKYDSLGNEVWVRRYNGPASGHDQPYDMALDGCGSVYITGRSQVDVNLDYATIKYDTGGDDVWTATYNGMVDGDATDTPHAIAVDDFGNAYVTGYATYEPANADYTTIKYTPEGNTLWVKRYSGRLDAYDVGRDILVDASGNVYVTGVSTGDGGGYQFATIKYVQFLRADVDKNGEVNIVDAVYLVNYVLRSGPVPLPAPIVGDASCDSSVDITDVIFLIEYLFRSGPAPCI